jgi:GNAT superfamily N-acetyltransferase
VASGSEPAVPGTGDELGPPRPLTESDLATAVPAIARAFSWHEPWGAWALPDPSTREATLAGLVEADVRERFLPAGEAWTIGGVSVTLWIPPAGEPGAELFSKRRSEADYAVYGPRGSALREADEQRAAMLPSEPHWYLDTLATDPAWRRKGLGARLLDHDLEVRDERGDACALDTHTAENVAFYGRRGFEVIASGRMPADGPELFVMFRPAGG